MSQVALDRPVFFIGMPRSGTTIVQEAFSSHEELGWLSNYTARFPASPWITVLHRLFGDAHGQRSQGQKLSRFNRLLPRPSESYPVWERLFGRKFLYTFLKNVSPSVHEIALAREYIALLLRAQNKARFCAKLTGPPRIEFLSGVFPDAMFIDIVRDPRAVVASLMVDKDEFWATKGGREKPFWDGALGQDALLDWEKSGRLPAVLAGLQWAAVYEQTRLESALAGSRYARIRYERFVAEPKAVMAELLNFCGLARSERVSRYVDGLRYESKNNKFLEVFGEKDLSWVERVVGRQLDELGYKRSTRAVGGDTHLAD